MAEYLRRMKTVQSKFADSHVQSYELHVAIPVVCRAMLGENVQ